MTLGEKLAMYRKQNNYTQEQLAELLGVSRQAVSKWESDLAYPETEKLIRLSEMYSCSLDYLIKDEQPAQQPEQTNSVFSLNLRNIQFERKSERMVRGVPLWHVNIGFGRTAKGIFALGFAAKGVFSCGMFSMGLFSCGVLSLGLLAFGSLAAGLLVFGALALGLIAFGGVALGLIAFGGLAVGVLSCGGASVGLVAVGGAAWGQYLALGDSASAQIAIGITEAYGEFTYLTPLDDTIRSQLYQNIETLVPGWLQWAADFVKSMLR